MATGTYNKGKFLIASGLLALNTADIRVLLVNSGYVFSAAHNFVSDVAFELSGSGYARKVLANKTLLENDTLNRIIFDADNVTWPAATFTGSGLGGGVADSVIVYVENVSDATRSLICCVDATPKIAPVANDYVLQFSAGGILVLV